MAMHKSSNADFVIFGLAFYFRTSRRFECFGMFDGAVLLPRYSRIGRSKHSQNGSNGSPMFLIKH